MTELVKLVKDGGAVACLVLNDPDRLNALTWEMGEAFESRVAELKRDKALRAVVIAGEGRAFSSGGNMAFIKENCERDPKENERLMVQFYKKFLSVVELPVPTLALIHGPAVGAGLALALACDLRLATNDAKMGLNFTRLGLTPGMGSSFFLPRVVGKARAWELFFSARLVKGGEAKDIGLVHDVYIDRGELLRASHDLLSTLTQNAPLALQGTKRLLNRDLDGLEAALRQEAVEQARVFATADIREGIAAIEAKRVPMFKGV